MLDSKIPFGEVRHQSPSKIPEQSHAFIIAATRLRELHFDKSAALLILRNSAAVFEFIEIVSRIRLNKIDEYVMENLINSVWE